MQQPTNPAPLHGVISDSGASYGYDVAGDRTNAGYSSNLISDSERRLTGWTNGSTTGAAGEGNRAAMQTITTSAHIPIQKSWTNRRAWAGLRFSHGILRRACPGRAARPAGRSIR
jgi:hypothetical protein